MCIAGLAELPGRYECVMGSGRYEYVMGSDSAPAPAPAPAPDSGSGSGFSSRFTLDLDSGSRFGCVPAHAWPAAAAATVSSAGASGGGSCGASEESSAGAPVVGTLDRLREGPYDSCMQETTAMESGIVPPPSGSEGYGGDKGGSDWIYQRALQVKQAAPNSINS